MLECIDLEAGPTDGVPVELTAFLVGRGATPLPGERSVVAGRPGLKKALRLIPQREQEDRDRARRLAQT